MRLDEIQYLIASKLNRDKDIEFLNSLIPSIFAKRALLIRQQFQKYQAQKYFELSIDVSLVKDDTIDDCNKSGCQILRSRTKIPKPVRFEYQHPFNRVSSQDKRITFEWTTPEQFEFIQHLTFTGHEPRYFWINDYIYIVNNNLLDAINIRFVPERPEELNNFDCINCVINDAHIPDDLSEVIIQLIIENELRILAPTNNNGEIHENAE
jgi:hypothetical protein